MGKTLANLYKFHRIAEQDHYINDPSDSPIVTHKPPALIAVWSKKSAKISQK